MSVRCKVLVVDDSAFARKVVREILSTSAEIEVVGTARDGVEALDKIVELQPDVITLDLMMPDLDGPGVMRALAAMGSRVRVVVVSMSGDDSALAIEALSLGALELVRKPSALATDRLYEMSAELIRKVLAVHGATTTRSAWGGARNTPPVGTPVAPRPRGWASSRVEVIAVGTSTGGPQALARILSGLPADLPAPVVIALHIPRDYTLALARRLSDLSALDVVEASEGLQLVPGMAALARGGSHLTVTRDGGQLIARLSPPGGAIYTPSVDILFESAARVAGPGVLGVVMTGMGDDGLIGSRAITAAGGRVVVEAEESAVVYGMPRCVAEAGLAVEQVSLDEIANAIVRQVAR